MVRISERTSGIRTHANGGSGRVGVKGQDERQTTAPLTPTRPLRELARSFCLTAEEAVIHGAPASCRHRIRGPPPIHDEAVNGWGTCALNSEGPKNQDPRPWAQTARDKDGVPGLLSFTSGAATPAAQGLRGGSTQRAGRSVLRYAR